MPNQHKTLPGQNAVVNSPVAKRMPLDPSRQSEDAARISAEITGPGSGSDPFAAAVRATRMPMIVTNPRLPDNPVVFVNDAFCRLSGYTRPEILGHNCRFLQGPGTDPAATARIREAVRAARTLEIDIQNYRKNGEPFWNRLLIGPVRDAAGELAYFFASQVDVTIERERLLGLENHNAALTAELADRLRDQQAVEGRLRFATDAGRIGIWELDLATNQFTTSAQFKRNFGRDPDGPFDWDDLHAAIDPDDRIRRAETFDRALATATDYEIEYRARRPNGEIRWLQVAARIVRDPDGTPLRAAGISLDVTERRRAELRLELSEQALRLATEAAEIGTWDLDLTTHKLTWSDRTKAMFGISPDIPCSMADFYQGLHPDDRDATTIAFASALDPAIRATYDVEYRTIGKQDGAIRWVAAKGKALFDDHGRGLRALGTAIDITARKSAGLHQAFLLKLLDQLRALTDAGGILTAAVTALARHLGASRAAYGQVQAGEAQIVLETSFHGGEPLAGTALLDSFHPDDIARQRHGVTIICTDTQARPSVAAVTWQRFGVGAFVSVPLVRDGRFRACLFVAQARPCAWAPADVTLIEDVAARTWDAVERARAEAAVRQANDSLEKLVAERTATLRANEARLRTIFQTSYQLQGLLTPAGIVQDANAASLAAIAARIEDVAGQPFWETPWFTATPGMPDTVRAALQAAATGQTVTQEITVQVATGWRTYDFSLRPVHDAAGAVVAIVTEAMDLTERRQVEEALRQAQKMEAVGQLTGGIAHDFNNLLTGITGSLELLNKRVAAGRTEGLERYTAAAMTSAQRAAALTQRLLAFARRQPLDPKRVDANRLVASMEDLLRRTLGPAVKLEIVLSGGLWQTLCDPNQLESALLNLVINARDAMPQGGRLTVETANTFLDDAYVHSQGHDLKPGQYVAVAVSDTGAGIPPEIIGKVFDPFFTTKPLGQGTGLGLSMLYGFVKQSEGHARVYSELGQGTTFKLYLPRHRAAAEPALPDPGGTAKLGLLAGRGETVLVVDDEASVRMLIMETLAELGYAAMEAADGQAALRLLQSNRRIDLLVTDVGLPGLNGRQLADAARVGRTGLKVLFVTGYAHNAALGNGDALEPGMEMITKPFPLEQLAAKMRSMLERA